MSLGARMLKSSGKRYLGTTGKRRLRGAGACACACGGATPCACADNVSGLASGCAECFPGTGGDVDTCTPRTIRVTLAGVSTSCHTDAHGSFAGWTSARMVDAILSGSFILTYTGSCGWAASPSYLANYYGAVAIGGADTTCSGAIQSTSGGFVLTVRLTSSPSVLHVSLSNTTGSAVLQPFIGSLDVTGVFCAGTVTVSNGTGTLADGTPSGGSGGTATVEFCP